MAVSYTQAIHHLANMQAVLNATQEAKAHRNGRERLRGAIETVAFVYQRPVSTVQTDLKFNEILERIVE